mmetsp:Transcript_23118/g.59405  ORF Transcript_23118/g.59405 Transcript_23118/m.59405 type:complete len:311 (+) Transcript_23118:83-1015(+)
MGACLEPLTDARPGADRRGVRCTRVCPATWVATHQLCAHTCCLDDMLGCCKCWCKSACRRHPCAGVRDGSVQCRCCIRAYSTYTVCSVRPANGRGVQAPSRRRRRRHRRRRRIGEGALVERARLDDGGGRRGCVKRHVLGRRAEPCLARDGHLVGAHGTNRVPHRREHGRGGEDGRLAHSLRAAHARRVGRVREECDIEHLRDVVHARWLVLPGASRHELASAPLPLQLLGEHVAHAHHERAVHLACVNRRVQARPLVGHKLRAQHANLAEQGVHAHVRERHAIRMVPEQSGRVLAARWSGENPGLCLFT